MKTIARHLMLTSLLLSLGWGAALAQSKPALEYSIQASKQPSEQWQSMVNRLVDSFNENLKPRIGRGPIAVKRQSDGSDFAPAFGDLLSSALLKAGFEIHESLNDGIQVNYRTQVVFNRQGSPKSKAHAATSNDQAELVLTTTVGLQGVVLMQASQIYPIDAADVRHYVSAESSQAREAAQKARALAADKARAEAQNSARQLASEQAKLQAEQARQQAEHAAKVAAADKAREEAEAATKLLAEEKSKLTAEQMTKVLAADKARAEAEIAARSLADEKVRLQAEQLAKQQADAQARQIFEKNLRTEFEQRELQIKAALTQAQLEAQARELAEKKAQFEAETQERLKLLMPTVRVMKVVP